MKSSIPRSLVRLALLTVWSMVLVACSTERISRAVPPCPPPPAPAACLPGYTKEVVYDTSRVMDGARWSIRRVSGANSSIHEWALLPQSGAFLLLSGERPGVATYRTVSRDNVSTISVQSIEIPGTVFVTSVLDNRITGDASIVLAEVRNGYAVSTSEIAAPVNLPLHWDGHPALNADGSLLVFASDRPGGEGGTDLYYSRRTSAGWTEPQHVVGVINTPCDELSPSFASDSVLLFASAGHSTVGGYDLFAATIDASGTEFSVGEPRNLGQPVNTPYDELFPVWADATTLYYSSDQPLPQGRQRKDFDVFVLTSKRLPTIAPAPSLPVSTPVQPPSPEEPVPQVTITGTVVREDTREPVQGADVTATDPQDNHVVAQTITDTAGKYSMDVPAGKPVDVQAQTPELFFDKVRIDVPAQQDSVQVSGTVPRDTITISQPLSLPATFVLRVNFPTAIYDAPYQYTLDSNGMETTQTWQQALDELATNVKRTGSRLKRLVLIGHTDDVDSDANNLVLGRNRVNFIMDQLVSRGVDRSVLEGRSAGESLLPNKRANESIVLWRKRARRVELVKVLQQ